MSKVLSTPNMMVWQYFQALRRLCFTIEQYQDQEKERTQQDAALATILGVTGVEIFMNVYFRVLVDEEPYKHAAMYVLDDLENQISLDKKIKNWPQVVLGRKLDLSSGAGQLFSGLKNLRNKLVHFSSSHESIELQDFKIQGMADTSVYTSLNARSAINALDVAERFICEIFRLRGISEHELPHALHSWTGKIPK